MLGLKPFITFSGNCEEALNYYKERLQGEILSLMRFEGAPMEIPEELKQKVMYSEFKFGDCAFMASDQMRPEELKAGNNISLSIGTTDLALTEKWFNSLARDGIVKMPLQDTFWGARFGIVTDKYGINWMFNCELAKQA